jgi:peptide-methionine (S)-S-oxide reductase
MLSTNFLALNRTHLYNQTTTSAIVKQLIKRRTSKQQRGTFISTNSSSEQESGEPELMQKLMEMIKGQGQQQRPMKGQMISKEQAIKGRDGEMRISDQHYVLGNSIKNFPKNIKTCVFATGCFWGTEKMFWRLPGVYSTSVGYVGGYTKNPTYEEVCSGGTGHTEAVQVAYDPELISFADLLAMYFTNHDPTQGMRQGNDSGTQYRSGVYCKDKEQYAITMSGKKAYQEALGSSRGEITSEIPEDFQLPYYFAEDYHQQYLAKPGSRPYCSAQPTGTAMPEQWLKANNAKLSAGFWKTYGPRPGCTIGVPNDPISREAAQKA